MATEFDNIDRQILEIVQQDASITAREIADQVGLTNTPAWRRIQTLENSGVIEKRVALVNAEAINVGVTALVMVRTNQHSAAWTKKFQEAIDQFPEVVEAYRTSGETDYILRVVVPSIAEWDRLYKRLIEEVDLYDVRTSFAMETLKYTTALPLHFLQSSD